MKNLLLTCVFSAYLMISPKVWAQDAFEIVSNYVNVTIGASSREAASILREAENIIRADVSLKHRIESERGRMAVHDALFWAGARSVAFSQNAFLEKFPNLYQYGRVLLITPDFYQSPRVVYQLNWTGIPEPRMLFGSGVLPTIATVEKVEKWDDNEGLPDWIGEYSFKNVDKRPYLVSTEVGRETTGATSVWHILGWVRIEADRLVPERFEAFDVPLGQELQPAHLIITALPVDGTISPSPALPPNPQMSTKDNASQELENRQSNSVDTRSSNEKYTPKPAIKSESASWPSREINRFPLWIIIVVLIASALGLLGLYIKRRL